MYEDNQMLIELLARWQLGNVVQWPRTSLFQSDDGSSNLLIPSTACQAKGRHLLAAPVRKSGGCARYSVTAGYSSAW